MVLKTVEETNGFTLTERWSLDRFEQGEFFSVLWPPTFCRFDRPLIE